MQPSQQFAHGLASVEELFASKSFCRHSRDRASRIWKGFKFDRIGWVSGKHAHSFRPASAWTKAKRIVHVHRKRQLNLYGCGCITAFPQAPNSTTSWLQSSW